MLRGNRAGKTRRNIPGIVSSSSVTAGYNEETGVKGVKALVFDAYGTLFDVHSVASVVNRRFPGRGLEVSTAWRARQLKYTWLRSLMARYEDFWRITESALIATCNAMNLELDPASRATLMGAYLRLAPFPGVRQTLCALSHKPLAILSNGSPKMLSAVVRNAGPGDMFSHIIRVDVAKTYKPSARAYHLALAKIREDRGDIGFVASNFVDVAGAKAFGFTSYWINYSRTVPDELGISPDAIVNSLADLVELGSV